MLLSGQLEKGSSREKSWKCRRNTFCMDYRIEMRSNLATHQQADVLSKVLGRSVRSSKSFEGRGFFIVERSTCMGVRPSDGTRSSIFRVVLINVAPDPIDHGQLESENHAVCLLAWGLELCRKSHTVLVRPVVSLDEIKSRGTSAACGCAS